MLECNEWTSDETTSLKVSIERLHGHDAHGGTSLLGKEARSASVYLPRAILGLTGATETRRNLCLLRSKSRRLASRSARDAPSWSPIRVARSIHKPMKASSPSIRA